MARIHPFRALRPKPEHAARVAAVPYDVVDTEEARELAEDNPLSLLHVSRPEIDFPAGTHPYGDEVYARAAANLNRLIDDGVLVRDPDDAIYVYRQVMGDHSQVGVVVCSPVDEYDQDLIRKHEKTRREKEDDRTRHTLAVSAHVGPVFLTYRGSSDIDRLVSRAVQEKPLYDLLAEDGIGHTVWKVTDTADWVAAFEPVPCLYVADGHHRAASASRARAESRSDSADAEVHRFLTVLFPADQLRILAYNRVVHDLNGLTSETFRERLGGVARVIRGGVPEPDRRGVVSMFLDDEWFRLELDPARVADSDPVESMDAAILQADVLAPLLAIDDPRTSDRIDFVGGIRGTGDLERRVREGRGAVAFSLFPVSVDQLMAVADAGRVLPPKSTWFEPKLRSGLVIHEF